MYLGGKFSSSLGVYSSPQVYKLFDMCMFFTPLTKWVRDFFLFIGLILFLPNSSDTM